MKAKRRWWRRVARIVAIGLASLVGLAVLALAFLHTPWGKRVVRRQLEQQLAAGVDGSVRLGTIDYTLLFGRIHLGDVEIDDARGHPAIRIAAIDAAIDRTSMLGREPVIEDLAVHGLAVSIVQTGDDCSNFTGLFKPSSPPSSPLARLRIAHFAIDGSVQAALPGGVTIAARDIDVRGSLDARPIAREVELALAPIAAVVSISGWGRPIVDAHVRVAGASLARRGDGADLQLDRIEAGPLAIAAIEAHLGLTVTRGADALAGPHRVSLRGVQLDHARLAALLGRDLLANDLALDATLTGPLDKLVVDGAVRAGGARVALAGACDLAAARPTYQLSLIGDDLGPRVVRGPDVPAVASALRVELRGAGTTPGDLDGSLDVAIRALGVNLSGRATIAPDQSMHAAFDLATSPAEAIAAFAAAGLAVPADLTRSKAQLPPRLDLAVKASGRLDGEVVVEIAPTRLTIAKGSVGLEGRAVVDHQQLRSVDARATLTSIDLAPLAALGGSPGLRGVLSGTLDVHQDGADPSVSYQLSLAAPEGVRVGVRGRADPSTVTAHATIVRGATRLATVDATLPIAKHGGAIGLRTGAAWTLAIDVARTSTAELAALLPPALRARVPRGELALHADVAGTPARPHGTIVIAATDGDARADIDGTFATTATGFAVTTRTTLALAHDPLATIDATVALPPLGNGAIDAGALRRDARLDARVDLPARTFASLAAIDPALAELDRTLGGTIAGTISAHGPADGLAFDAALRWQGYRTVAGGPGHTELHASGTAAAIDVRIVHGDALVIAAHLDRSAPDRVAVTASARANDAPLAALLPAFLAPYLGAAEPGRLRSDLSGRFVLRGAADAPLVEDVDATGSLAIAGASFPIPDSDRRIRDVALALTADPRGIAIAASGHERALDRRDRRVEATGRLSFADRRPARLDLAVTAHDWLLFGAGFGAAAAPHATVDGEVAVAIDLAAPVLGVDATVRSLELDAPERNDLLLQQPSMIGDVIEVTPGHAAGTLPVAPRDEAPSRHWPMDLAIHIPSPVHLIEGPLDVTTHGELAVHVRADRVESRGKLIMDGGALLFFGKRFDLTDGSVELSAQHPDGWMALTLERPLADASVRDVSKASELPRARLSLVGPLASPKMTFSGATNREFIDVVAVGNVGHAHYVTAPGLAVSASAQAPRGEPLFMTAFLTILAPQLLFLDRIAAWSDPADGRYGQIQHVEAERDLEHDGARVRGVMRPPTPGRSATELQYDRVLLHDDRTAAGVGLRAGDRAGGGIGVFLEWSSQD